MTDADYKPGKNDNILYSTGNLRKAVRVACESGEGVIISSQMEVGMSNEIVFISPYQTNPQGFRVKGDL